MPFSPLYRGRRATTKNIRSVPLASLVFHFSPSFFALVHDDAVEGHQVLVFPVQLPIRSRSPSSHDCTAQQAMTDFVFLDIYSTEFCATLFLYRFLLTVITSIKIIPCPAAIFCIQSIVRDPTTSQFPLLGRYISHCLSSSTTNFDHDITYRHTVGSSITAGSLTSSHLHRYHISELATFYTTSTVFRHPTHTCSSPTPTPFTTITLSLTSQPQPTTNHRPTTHALQARTFNQHYLGQTPGSFLHKHHTQLIHYTALKRKLRQCHSRCCKSQAESHAPQGPLEKLKAAVAASFN